MVSHDYESAVIVCCCFILVCMVLNGLLSFDSSWYGFIWFQQQRDWVCLYREFGGLTFYFQITDNVKYF